MALGSAKHRKPPGFNKFNIFARAASISRWCRTEEPITASKGPSMSQSSNRPSLKRTCSDGRSRFLASSNSSGEMSTAISWAPEAAKYSVKTPVPQPTSRTRASRVRPAALAINSALRRARILPAGVPQPQSLSVSPWDRKDPWAISCFPRKVSLPAKMLYYLDNQ